jgi:DNA-binding CsgD family transcriptional regulator
MLVGRELECARIDAVLDAARGRRSGALVLRGEAGIGKTALLEYAVAQAGDFRVLRALGVESEAELPFAALQQLLRPVLDAATELPLLQSRALRTAFAIEAGPAPERLTVSVATLSLLAAAAEDGPILCVVDDAHWLDQASSEVVTFAARRVEAEAIALFFAAREPETAHFSAEGVPELRVQGLGGDAARALLVEGPDLADPVAQRLLELTEGNPLALIEIPRALSMQQRLGQQPFDEPLPIGSVIERAFLERVNALTREAQRSLLLVAAGGDADSLWPALETAGLGVEAIEEAEDAGLLVRGRSVFAHPLARSAVYQGVRPAERRAAHAALAEVTADPDRRAWHLAAATEGPDEMVAAALDDAATAARRRGGAAAEARALERAAQLTPDTETRARRLLRAALAAYAAGWDEHSERLHAYVADLTSDPQLRARAIGERAYLLYWRGEFDRAHAIAVREVDSAPPEEAGVILAPAVTVLFHRLEIPAALALAQRAWQLAGPAADASGDLCWLPWMQTLAGRHDEALALLRSSVDRVEPGTTVAIQVGTTLLYLEDYARAREVLESVVKRTREAEAPGILSYALDQLAKLETREANLMQAYALELESLQMAELQGRDVGLAASLVWLDLIESMLGREERGTHAQTALVIAEGRGDAYNVVRARGALGLAALARGDAAEAADWLEPAVEMVTDGGVGNPNWFRLDADLIEALARLGRSEDAEPHLARFEQHAQSTCSLWGRAAAARCRAFLAPDSEMVDAFETALRLQNDDPSTFERARTELCYGERLRRVGQRRAAREQLGSALTTFDRIGAQPWAERAQIELRASGAHLRRRDPTAAEQLTPQELQIALLVAEGLTNRDVAARLFLSPKTIEFHLTRIYRKLEIHSRAELVRRMVHSEDQSAARAAGPI